MPLANVNNQKLFYAARALDRQPPLLLIHGAGGSHLDWPAQLRRFGPLGVCALDLPGHGRSPGPARSNIADYASDAIQLATAIGLSQFVVVGHSMGGAIALEIALRCPEKVTGLVLVATGARLRVGEALLGLAGNDHAAAVQQVTAVAWGPAAPPELVSRSSQLMLSCDPVSLQMDFTACNDFDCMARLEEINAPTLVMVGTEDHMTPPKYGQYLSDHIPLAEFVSIPGAGHMLAMERPDQVSELIDGFLSRRGVA